MNSFKHLQRTIEDLLPIIRFIPFFIFSICSVKIGYYMVFNISLDIEKPNINSETLQKKEIKESKRKYHSSKSSDESVCVNSLMPYTFKLK